MRALVNLPKAKWWAAGKQPGNKPDMQHIEVGLLEVFEMLAAPGLVWVDNTEVKVPATADSPAGVVMSGFPNVLHPGQMLPDGAGLSDGKYRENAAGASLDFDLAAALWGTEKASQWYAVLAIAGAADTTFTLKAMPFLTVKSQTGQVISLGTFLAPGTGIGYGFSTDQFAGGSKIYILSGVSKGQLRPVLHNNNDNGAGGTLEYSGAALTLAQGDRFIILPATNFRRLGDLWNNSSSNFTAIGGLLAESAEPAGRITMTGAATADPGNLLCDGAAYSRTAYAGLFARIGTAFGAGDGSTTFNVPDLRQRFPIGKAASGTGSVLGGTGGGIDNGNVYIGSYSVIGASVWYAVATAGSGNLEYGWPVGSAIGNNAYSNPPFQAVNFQIAY